MHKVIGQLAFADSWLDKGLGRNERLERISQVLDWVRVERLVSGLHDAPEGRRAYAPLTMLKALLLQQWYDLSDPRLEEILSDSLSFRRFSGLGLDDGTPDHSTISRFRKLLREKQLDQAVFDEVGRQLEERGLVLKHGSLLDATLVEAQAARPQNKAGGQSEVDPDATWTTRGGKSHFGYKGHVSVDEGSGLIRRTEFTDAKTYESEVADSLICGDEGAVYADKAYEHKARRARLKGMGIKDRIMHRANKHHPRLPYWKRQRNALIAPIRAAVERVFGTFKRTYRYTKVRYFSLNANRTQFRLLCIAYNLRRAVSLTA